MRGNRHARVRLSLHNAHSEAGRLTLVATRKHIYTRLPSQMKVDSTEPSVRVCLISELRGPSN